MPATPDGRTIEAKFKPMIAETGLKHPVTRGLDGWMDGKPELG